MSRVGNLIGGGNGEAAKTAMLAARLGMPFTWLVSACKLSVNRLRLLHCLYVGPGVHALSATSAGTSNLASIHMQRLDIFLDQFILYERSLVISQVA